MPLIITTDLASIQNTYNNYSNSFAPGTYYRFLLLHNVEYDILGGGTWYVEGIKQSADYEWQEARCYSSTGIKVYVRSKYSGVWNAWVAK